MQRLVFTGKIQTKSQNAYIFSIHHFLAQLGHDEFKHPVLHISHIKEVVILEKENLKKEKIQHNLIPPWSFAWILPWCLSQAQQTHPLLLTILNLFVFYFS